MVDQSVIDTDKEEPNETPWAMREPAEATDDEIRNSPWRLGLVFLGLAALWFFTNTIAFVVAVGLIISIFLHELGHYMTARWTGMKATQFFLFMGPRIWSFKRGETEYGIRTYPIGAFVRIVGMSNLDPPEEDEAERAYMHKSYPRRLLVITAGSIMHGIIALVLFVVSFNILGFQVGDPDSGWTVGPTDGGPAADAGIGEGDIITAVDGVDTTLFADLVDHLGDQEPGDVVQVEFESDGVTSTVPVTLAEQGDRAILCITQVPNEFRTERAGPTAAFVASADFVTGTFANLNQVPGAYVESLRNIGSAEEVNVSPTANGCNPSAEGGRLLSVIGIVRLAGGLGDLSTGLALLAGVNIALGIFNMLPLLPLDGGHAAVATYEAIRSRKGKRHYADFNKLVPLTYVVIFLLLAISLPLFWLDIFRNLTLG